MFIRILGTRGEIKSSRPGHTKHSGILIDHGIMLDIGERGFLNYHPVAIFITHLHPDHAFFMTTGETTTLPVPVYAPEKTGRAEKLNVIKGEIKFSGYKITPIPILHSIKVKSAGYLVEKENKRIFYTGDIVSIKRKYLKQLGDLDLVITEGSFLRKGGLIRKNKQGEMFGHSGIPDLVDLFKAHTNHIIFTHFGTWFMKDVPSGIKKIKSLETKDLKVDVAVDGMEFEV